MQVLHSVYFMALPNINQPTGGAGLPREPIKRVEVPRPKPPKPEPPKTIPQKEPSPFKKSRFIPQKDLETFLRSGKASNIAEGSPVTIQKIQARINELFPASGGSITPERLDSVEKKLAERIQFQRSPDPKLDQKTLDVLKEFFQR